MKDLPNGLRPYSFHGLDLDFGGGDEATCDCPWCGRVNKFSINMDTGQWHCWTCSEGNDNGGGNIHTFMQVLWRYSSEATTSKDYQTFAEDRKLLYPETLVEWSVVKSCVTGDWLVPGYNPDGKMTTLYRYVYSYSKKRWLLLTTPTLGHRLFGGNLYDPSKPTVYVTEGPWDAMSLWEVVRRAKLDDNGRLVLTASQSSSVGSAVNVLGIPGCMTFADSWHRLFGGRTVVLLLDNDHPTRNPKTGKLVAPASRVGTRRIAERLGKADHPPDSVSFCAWGAPSRMYSEDLPAGYDVRDHLTAEGSGVSERVRSLSSLIDMVVPAPEDWFKPSKAGSNGSDAMTLGTCTEYRRLVTCWRKALRWTSGLDCALSVMLASIASTKAVGDQLWVKIIGPAACGKSTLCEAVSTNKQYVLAKSTIRGFHSGFGDGEEDCSLLSMLYGRTLVTKDGDTLIQSPNLGQILSEARDVYDSVSRTHYRNRNSRDYSGVRMTWILCGTSSLRCIDSSELGERFLDCVIMDGIDDELEDDILWRVVNRADRNLAIEADGKPETHYEPELVEAMAATGGYVQYLRENARDLLETTEFSDNAKRRCARLGKFVAYMRARPSKHQDESAEREFSTRLASQLIRLSKCMAVVMNRTSVDEDVMARVHKVAYDTSRGHTYDICKYLYDTDGAELRAVALNTALAESRVKELLRFMRQIGALRLHSAKVQGVVKRRWVLSDYMRRLFDEVEQPPTLT